MAPWGKGCLKEYKPIVIPLHRRPFVDLQNRDQEAHCCRQQKQQVAGLPDKENVQNASTFGNVCPIPQDKRRMKSKGVEQCGRNIDITLLKDIYFNMKVTESKGDPLFRISDSKISFDMRSCFIDWLIYKAESFALDTATLHLAVYYADMYFSKVEAGVEDFPVVASCAILLASKLEENRDHIPKVSDLIKHSGNGFSRKEILQMEQKMLEALDFKMSYPTGYEFLQVFCHLLDIKDEEAFLAQYLCEIALIYEDVYFYNEPSKIAAASLITARSLNGVLPWFHDLLDISGYGMKELLMTSYLLCDKFKKIKTTQFKKVVVKYSSSDYKNVSEKSYPNALSIQEFRNLYLFLFYP